MERDGIINYFAVITCHDIVFLFVMVEVTCKQINRYTTFLTPEMDTVHAVTLVQLPIFGFLVIILAKLT